MQSREGRRMPKKSGKGKKAARSPAKVKVKSASAKHDQGAMPHGRSRSRTLIEINQDKELQALFAEIDADNSGELERCEVSTMVSRMGYPPMTEEQLDALFEEFDDDHSGTVSFDEF
eukprot:SAG11_NODE_19680_length_461_cov_1.104972_1_plen_117_part_00